MLSVLLCDDDNEFLEYLEKHILHIIPDARTLKFCKADAAMLYIDEIIKGDLDVVFLDIEFGDRNGIELAKEIKKSYQHIQIIFITGYIDYSTDIFDAQPIYFLLKPIDITKLTKALEAVLNSQENEKKSILSLKEKGAIYKINMRDILYIESYKRLVIVHTDNKNFKAYQRLDDLEKILPVNFVRCHQSYIVNMDYVHYLDKSFGIKNCIKIPISQLRLNETRKNFLRYLGECI